ncbi:hypothetical protein ScPMuIL_015706 [Solemya velum]
MNLDPCVFIMAGLATVSNSDMRDVSTLVGRKLDLYMNLERTEDRFCTAGFYRTKPQMQRYVFLYQVLDSTVLDQSSPRNVRKRRKNLSKSDKNKPNVKVEEFRPITLHLLEHPRRVVPYRQADRLEDYANDVIKSFPIDRLQMLHRHRPSHPELPPNPEHGKVQGYTQHVGSILHTQKFVDYYNREGLQYGNKERCKRPKDPQTSKKGAAVTTVAKVSGKGTWVV